MTGFGFDMTGKENCNSYTTMINLRPYQTECLETINSSFRKGIRRQVVHLPTGAGKTVVFASLIEKTIRDNPSSRVLVLAFSCDLLEQAKEKIKMIAPQIEVGIVDMHRKEFDSQVVVSSIQSARISKNLDKLKAHGFSLCIADECHRFACDSARLVLNHLEFSLPGCQEGNLLLVGFSATPFRSDEKGLGEVFDKIVYTRTIKQMIDDGYLCRPVGHKIVTDVDLSRIATENGDYEQNALARIMNTDAVNDTIVSSYLEKSFGTKAITFCTSIDHANAISDRFRKSGVNAEAIHSELDKKKRDELKKRFKEGEITMLVNPLLLCEGYDEPSIETVVIARPTKSPGLYQQMVGRGLRLFPNKTHCTVIDFCDVNHTLCNVGILLNDIEIEVEEKKTNKLSEIASELPETINPKLKKAILEFDLLGNDFTWKKDGFNYSLKGNGNLQLLIEKTSEDRYQVLQKDGDIKKILYSDLDFEYAFSSAEDFVKNNRPLFSVSDLDASWRKLPISDKQLGIFKSSGYRSGISDLTRGQAAQIIQSGVLKRRAFKS